MSIDLLNIPATSSQNQAKDDFDDAKSVIDKPGG